MEFTRFIWATGIENTFIPQSRPGYRALEEYELMGHYEHWREDLALVRELGVPALRWGVPWYRVEPERGRFEWTWVDHVIEYFAELNLTPIIDLIHYGCPLWLTRGFASANYPSAVAEYAAAFANRYGRTIRWYTPLNEPLITALMCGKRGVWPPYLRGDRGYIRVLLQIVKGIIETVTTLDELVPDSVMVHVEATGLSRPARADLEVLAIEDQHRGYLTFDLLTKRVNHQHPLFGWLIRNGVSPDELAAIAARDVRIDILGMNFYPQWSTVQLYIDDRGRLAYRPIERDGAGFRHLIEDYYQRYHRPIMVTETSARGPVAVRERWLAASVTAVRQLRAQGTPVVGYTWFPLFTMIDWRYRFGRGPVSNYRLDLGLYSLNGETGRRWKATPLVREFQEFMRGGPDALTAAPTAN